MNIVDRARKFAQRAHKTQLRKFTGEPYFVHLDAVAKTVARHGASKRAIAAAYLHDTIEDQPVTYEDIVNEFGKDVADIVRDLTDQPPAEGLTRKMRKQIDIDRLSKAGVEAQTIKCADMLDNTKTIVVHDPGFARTYLPEKRAALTVMTRADETLRALAWESLIKAERTLGI